MVLTQRGTVDPTPPARVQTRRSWKISTLKALQETTICNQSRANQQTAKLSSAWRSGISKPEGIVLAILMHFVVIGTNGIIAVGGDNIATRSFSLAGDIISWTEATGIRRLVTTRCTTITITMARSTLTVICCPIR